MVTAAKYEYFSVEQVMAYLEPILKLYGHTKLCRILGVDDKRIRIVKAQKTIRADIVDKWFTKLGLINAYNELVPVAFGTAEPPQSQYYEE